MLLIFYAVFFNGSLELFNVCFSDSLTSQGGKGNEPQRAHNNYEEDLGFPVLGLAYGTILS